MDEERDRPRAGAVRWAAWVFAAVVLVALPVIMYQGREQSFFLDEWDFLAGRELASLDDLLRPHNEHWSTLPIVVYRVLYRLVGLHHYWPYQVCVVLLHLLCAVLLRVVMRRAGVDPWIATAAASLFAFLGSGRENIEFAFQIGFTGSLALGLAHLLLADHDGPFGRRDIVGLACGLAGLLCSGVGVTMTAIVGATVLLRRGGRMAIAHTAPLAGIFLLWFVLYGRDSYSAEHGSVSQVASFMGNAVVNAFARMGQVGGAGFVLGALLVAGLVLALRTPTPERRRYAAPAGLLLGAVLFLALVGYGRAAVDLFGQEESEASRYVHLVSAMVLPALALSASLLGQRWRPLLAVGAAALLVGLPGNIEALRPSGSERFTLGDSTLLFLLPRLPLARKVPRDLQPLPFSFTGVRVGWLIDAEAAGRLPDPRPVNRKLRDNGLVALSLSQQEGKARAGCRTVPATSVSNLRGGQQIVLPAGATTVRRVVGNVEQGSASYFVGGNFGPVLRVTAGPIAVRIEPATPAARARACP
ncbi:MAG: hypothetical protein WKF43_05620 [Acidimicrobiales bacterium]